MTNHIKQKTFTSLHFYSKYYYYLLSDCEYLRMQEKGHSALLSLFSVLENVIKSRLNDFESNFNILIDKLFELNIITSAENHFLNNKENGIRKIRNIFAHANLSKYDLKYNQDTITYPFSENESCLKFYDLISDVVFAIILKVINDEMKSGIENHSHSDEKINSLNYQILIRTPEELMKFKGIEFSENFENLSESAKYRLAENSSDVNLLQQVLKNLTKE